MQLKNFYLLKFSCIHNLVEKMTEITAGHIMGFVILLVMKVNVLNISGK